MKNILILAVLFLLGLKFLTGMDHSSSDDVSESEPKEVPVKKKRLQRKIASVGGIEKAPRVESSKRLKTSFPGMPDYVVEKREELDGLQSELKEVSSPGEAVEENRFKSTVGYSRPSLPFRRPSHVRPAPEDTRSSSGSPTSETTSVGGLPGDTIIGGAGIPVEKSPPKKDSESGGGSSTGSSGGGEGSTSSSLSCSSNLDSGTYHGPVSIALSCSRPGTIRYCLQEGGGCCDPVTSSITYTSPITLGADADTYCLSFYGESGDKASSVIQRNYLFDPDMPQLTVSHSKKFYQTTQLFGKALITSSDFGNPDYVVGQVNSFDKDPGSGWHNLSCQEFVDTYLTLTPAPVETVIPVNMSSFSLADQIIVNLNLPKLSYGDNYITSFAAHVNYVEKVTCSTTKIVLKDFEYFQATPAYGDIEFSGTLTPYGYFLEGGDFSRGPAGTTIEEKSGQELREGMFGIFF